MNNWEKYSLVGVGLLAGGTLLMTRSETGAHPVLRSDTERRNALLVGAGVGLATALLKGDRTSWSDLALTGGMGAALGFAATTLAYGLTHRPSKPVRTGSATHAAHPTAAHAMASGYFAPDDPNASPYATGF